MQTHDENLNDLIESLKISSAYRQEQEERVWRQRAIRECSTFDKREGSMKIRKLQ
jgi:hypothetical protein